MAEGLARRVADRANGNGNGAEVATQATKTLAQQIREMEQQFRVAMPRGAEAAQLVRDALTCLRTIRNLDKCEAASVLGALMTCAQLGLRPGVLGHAWPLPFYDGRAKCYKAQLVIGFQGYRELAMRSGLVASIIARPVHEHDLFDIDYGIADNLVHKPNLTEDRGVIVGYYAIVKYANGGYAFWHMSKGEVITHRDRYVKRDRNGQLPAIWRDDDGGNLDEMACKTTFLRLAKWMPKSTEMAMAIEADGTVRVDLTPNNDAALHGEHPGDDAIDGEVVGGEQGSGPVSDTKAAALRAVIDNGHINAKTEADLLTKVTGRQVSVVAELTAAEAEAVGAKLLELGKQESLAEAIAEYLDRPAQAGGAR